MFDWLVEAGQWLWTWFVDVVTDAAEGIWTGLFAALPDLSGTSLAPFADFLTVANQYLPLTEAVALMLTYWGFLVVFVTVKMVLKLIPTVG